MLIVNLYAGPGSGKSTTAAALFARLKRDGVRAELVTEVAKDLTWENPGGRWASFQLKLLADQSWRIERLRDHAVQVVVSDSPVLLGLVYCPPTVRALLEPVALHEHRKNWSDNIFLVRNKPYVPVGRLQTEEQARALDSDVQTMLVSLGVPFMKITDGPGVEEDLANRICVKLGVAQGFD